MRTVWMVGGNKGGVGKSVMAKALADWLLMRDHRLVIADGDSTADVAKAYSNTVDAYPFDLTSNQGWANFTDWLCAFDESADVVVNLPDSVTDKTITSLERYKPSVDEYGYETKAIFMMNTLPDGMDLLPRLLRAVRNVYPVKNLYFGEAAKFEYFDTKYSRHFAEQTIYFPRLYPPVMNRIRAANMAYQRAIEHPAPDTPRIPIFDRLALAQWFDDVTGALDEVLEDTL